MFRMATRSTSPEKEMEASFFTGFGSKKRVALYDTLIEKQETDELVAIVRDHAVHARGHDEAGGAGEAEEGADVLAGCDGGATGQGAGEGADLGAGEAQDVAVAFGSQFELVSHRSLRRDQLRGSERACTSWRDQMRGFFTRRTPID